MIIPLSSYELLYDSVIERVRLDHRGCDSSAEMGWPGDIADVLEMIERHERAFHTPERWTA